MNEASSSCAASPRDARPLAMKVAVFGSGSFGTAMACVVARNGHDVVVLTRREDVARGVDGR